MALARRIRGRARADERGAALFIVVLIVTLLTAIGVFAAHATSLAQTASGYSRRAAMATHLAEFSLVTVAVDMANEPKKYDKGLLAGAGQCRANVGLDPSLDQCMVINSDDAELILAGGDVVTDPSGALYGVLSRDDSVSAAFNVEIFQPVLAADPTEGMGATGAVTTKTWETMVEATARILPASALANQCTADLTRASEKLSIRSIVLYTSTGG